MNHNPNKIELDGIATLIRKATKLGHDSYSAIYKTDINKTVLLAIKWDDHICGVYWKDEEGNDQVGWIDIEFKFIGTGSFFRAAIFQDPRILKSILNVEIKSCRGNFPPDGTFMESLINLIDKFNDEEYYGYDEEDEDE